MSEKEDQRRKFLDLAQRAEANAPGLLVTSTPPSPDAVAPLTHNEEAELRAWNRRVPLGAEWGSSTHIIVRLLATLDAARAEHAALVEQVDNLTACIDGFVNAPESERESRAYVMAAHSVHKLNAWAQRIANEVLEGEPEEHQPQSHLASIEQMIVRQKREHAALREEVERWRGIYESAVRGRQEFRTALRKEREMGKLVVQSSKLESDEILDKLVGMIDERDHLRARIETLERSMVDLVHTIIGCGNPDRCPHASDPLAFVADAVNEHNRMDVDDSAELKRLHDALATVERERDELRDHLSDVTKMVETRDEAGRMVVAALVRTGVHPPSCPKGVGIGYYEPRADARCDCGIDAALALVATTLPQWRRDV